MKIGTEIVVFFAVYHALLSLSLSLSLSLTDVSKPLFNWDGNEKNDTTEKHHQTTTILSREYIH